MIRVIEWATLAVFVVAILRFFLTRPGRRDWIQTFTGQAVRPLNVRPEDVDIRDIARHLSMLCRYAGAVQRFYSIAEHSVRVARRVWELTGDVEWTRKAAVHDSPEAYLVDVPSPLKRSLFMWFYRWAERRAARSISIALGVMIPEPKAVKAADTEILGTEARQLKSPVHPEWRLPPALNIGPLGWEPWKAEHVFLQTWNALNGNPAEVGPRMVALAREYP
jgi:hypothetical protein